MKKLFVILILVCLLVMGATHSLTNTIRAKYILLRAEADENSSTIDLTSAGDFAQKPSAAIRLPANGDSGYANAVQLIFCGGSAADKTFSYKLYGWRNGNGPAEMLATGTGTLGTQAVVKYPHNSNTATNKFWADTLAISDQGAVKTFYVSDASGANRVAKLYGDICGYEWLYCEITGADGATGNEAGDVSVYFSYF